MSLPIFWLAAALSAVAALTPRFFVKAVYQRWFPTDIQIAYEAEVQSSRRTRKPAFWRSKGTGTV